MKTQTITLQLSLEHDLTKEELEQATSSAYENAMRAFAGYQSSTGHYVRTASKTA